MSEEREGRLREYVSAFDGARDEYTGEPEVFHRDLIAEAADELARLRAEVAQLTDDLRRECEVSQQIAAERDRYARFLVREGYHACDGACNCGEWHGSKWQRRLDECKAERDRYRAALEEIVDPISAMQRWAEAEGYRLDGAMAVSLSKDPGHLQNIARRALAPTGGDDAR